MRFFKCKHDYKEVAIDTSNHCKWTNHDWDLDKQSNQEPICIYVHFLKCSKCGHREVKIGNADLRIKKYAEEQHEKVIDASLRWIHNGIIPDNLGTIWVDAEYAPHGEFEKYIDLMRNDNDIAALIDEHQMIRDAIGQLEVAAKLCQNNKKDGK